MVLKINNQIYDAAARGWWDETSFLHAMGVLLNPVRVSYFTEVISRNIVSRNVRILDVGCGGGSLAEEFSRHGHQVTGIDISSASIDQAREHAKTVGLHIEYLVASGDNLPFPDAQFDVVSCCEVLEHVRNPGEIVQECSRILRPGGVFLFATPNRTVLTWLGLVKLVQDWKLTAVSPPDMHLHHMFIRPDEMTWLLSQADIKCAEVTGVRPGIAGSWRRLLILPGLRLGFMTYSDSARLLRLGRTRTTALAYMGYGLR